MTRNDKAGRGDRHHRPNGTPKQGLWKNARRTSEATSRTARLHQVGLIDPHACLKTVAQLTLRPGLPAWEKVQKERQ
jgi:hypothetical protein